MATEFNIDDKGQFVFKLQTPYGGYQISKRNATSNAGGNSTFVRAESGFNRRHRMQRDSFKNFTDAAYRKLTAFKSFAKLLAGTIQGT